MSSDLEKLTNVYLMCGEERLSNQNVKDAFPENRTMPTISTNNQMKTDSWYANNSDFGYVNGKEINLEIVNEALSRKALQSGIVAHSSTIGGVPTRPVAAFQDVLLKHFPEAKLYASWHQTAEQKQNAEYYEYFYAWPTGGAKIRWQSDGVGVDMTSLDKETMVACLEEVSALKAEKAVDGRVYTIVSGGGGLSLQSAGVAGVLFESGNYSEEACEGFDWIVQELKNKDPVGRISLLEGPPGTGKTFFLRSLIQAVPQAYFVIMPSAMVGSLQGPELQALLMQFKGKNCPIVLIIEDADHVICTRGPDTMHTLSTLLNMTDGMQGHLFDIRVIATTNADYNDIEPAIVRDGRLSIYLHVGRISLEKANTILRRITDKADATMPPSDDDTYLLASVYAESKKNNRPKFLAKPKKVGFGS